MSISRFVFVVNFVAEWRVFSALYQKLELRICMESWYIQEVNFSKIIICNLTQMYTLDNFSIFRLVRPVSLLLGSDFQPYATLGNLKF